MGFDWIIQPKPTYLLRKYYLYKLFMNPAAFRSELFCRSRPVS